MLSDGCYFVRRSGWYVDPVCAIALDIDKAGQNKIGARRTPRFEFLDQVSKADAAGQHRAVWPDYKPANDHWSHALRLSTECSDKWRFISSRRTSRPANVRNAADRSDQRRPLFPETW